MNKYTEIIVYVRVWNPNYVKLVLSVPSSLMVMVFLSSVVGDFVVYSSYCPQTVCGLKMVCCSYDSRSLSPLEKNGVVVVLFILFALLFSMEFLSWICSDRTCRK